VAERDSTASQAQGLFGRPGEHTLLAVLVLESRYGGKHLNCAIAHGAG
jgi:hypothetical protein